MQSADCRTGEAQSLCILHSALLTLLPLADLPDVDYHFGRRVVPTHGFWTLG